MFTVKISSDYMTQIDINYKSYPNLKLIKAIEMSCCIPLIFKTIIHNNDCYLDGGFLNSFPLNNCLKKHSNKNEVFAIKNLLINEKVKINEKSSVSVLINIIINKVLEKLDQKYKKINNMIIVNNDIVNNLYKNQSPSKVWLDSMNKKNTRKELVYQGEKLGQQYLKTRINELL
jgi:predicted acylesterase/phospholipase RssA